MGFINFIAELLKDPRTAIASWIAAGPLMAYGCVFLIIFIETGVVFFPFLPGDSLLFASGFFAHNGGFNIVALLAVAWSAAILGDQCNFMIGHFFGKKIIASGKVKAMTPERIKKSEDFLDKWGHLAIFLGRFFPFLPGDSLLFASGFFAHNGGFSIVALLATAWTAAILGDQCNFMIGHFFGKKIIASGKVKAMTPERIKKSEDFLDKWGHLAIFLGRFFPFIRTFVPFIAGMGGMHWRNFVIFNVLGGITWSTLFTLLGYFFGGIPFVQEHFELLIVGIVAVSIIPTVVGLVKAKLGKKNA